MLGCEAESSLRFGIKSILWLGTESHKRRGTRTPVFERIETIKSLLSLRTEFLRKFIRTLGTESFLWFGRQPVWNSEQFLACDMDQIFFPKIRTSSSCDLYRFSFWDLEEKSEIRNDITSQISMRVSNPGIKTDEWNVSSECEWNFS